MDEHDDDLESTVDEDAEEERDEFPNTADQLDEAGAGETEAEGEDLNLDDDEAEL